jgi:hypothetical protein
MQCLNGQLLVIAGYASLNLNGFFKSNLRRSLPLQNDIADIWGLTRRSIALGIYRYRDAF